jgi:chlorobactene glucosyltransferase
MMQELTFLLLSVVLQWIVVPLLAFCLLHSILNMRMMYRLKPIPNLGNAGKPQDVSILVPARNEERRIRECILSLMNQEPPALEIILLDDRSTDRTAEIAKELGFIEGTAGGRLRLIRGTELPGEWVGKNWACHQLFQAANPGSSHLLFTDADTIHGSACLRTALNHAEAKRLDLLSLWPGQITGTWSEKLVIPLGYLIFMAFHPFPMLAWLQADPGRVARWRVSRERLVSMGAANGQFLLFRRDAYESIGGHEALKGHLVEDIAFGRRLAARTGEGMRLANADGIDLLRCRMYSGIADLWRGFSKNLRPVFEESHVGFFLFGIVIFTLFLMPFPALLLAPLFPVLKHSSLTAVFIIFLTRLMLALRFRTSWLGLIGHPVAVALALLIALNSWRLCLRGRVSWKGRNYSGVTRSSL